MRITNQLAFQNAQNNYQKTMKNLFRTNQQLGSGLKIQNSFENTGIYVDAMRLDYEASTLVQVKETSSKAQAFANNTDKAFNQFSESFDQFKYKLIQAANEGAMSSTSREAIANDLEGIKNHLMNVSNTSINGTFLFSGSATNIKPISADGTYNGNGESIKALVGSGVELAYDIDGESLFLGTSGDYQKLITTNMPMLNQAKLNPTVMSPNEGDISREEYLRSSDKIRDMVGDSDSDKANDPSTVFYLSGSDSYGNGINQKIEMTSDAPISDLLKRIGNAYGNTSTNEVVNVSLNDRGQIEIKDLRKGSNQLEFHMFGAIDRVAAPNSAGNADVTDLDALFSNPNVDIVEFIKSNFKSNPTASTVPDGANYDRRGLEQVGSHLKGNASQIVNKTGAYATSKDTLVSAAGVDDLNGKIFRMEIVDINGYPRTVEINLADPQSTFSVDMDNDGTMDDDIFVIFDGKGGDTSSSDMTYRQLMDVMGMAASGSFPQDSDLSGTIDADEYSSAIKTSRNRVDVDLDTKGRFELIDRTNSVTPMRLNIYDTEASNFGTPSALRFMENNALTIDEPSLNVFEDLDRMIEAVRTGTYHANGEGADPRNIGIQNSIERLDHIMDHFTRSHTKIGALSNALKDTQERSELLIVNVNSVKSEIIDADYGETMIQFQQLALSYEAMLSSVAKINSLSLLNYL